VRRVTAFVLVLAAAGLGGGRAAGAAPAAVLVSPSAELSWALFGAKPGTRVRVAPGTYAGGLFVENLRGEEGRPITVTAADPAKRPVVRGGANGIQLVDPAHVELVDLDFEGASGNGINVDDGGTPDTPAHHVVLRGVRVRDVGPGGNRDGIKLSGVGDARLEGCAVTRWGTGGSAVDMVGCARVTIEGCTFEHVPGADGASGVQAKGGSRDVVVRRCRFVHAGGRAVNAGGSTGLAYFRPPLERWSGPRWEAKDVLVEGCEFTGSQAAIAFVGVDGAVFRFNSVHAPGRWAIRILQETREDGFVACRGGVVSDNVFAFRSDRWSEGGVNVGAGTEPTSFRFERNAWTCLDEPARSKSLVRLPVEEKGAVHGEDPRFTDPERGDLRPRAGGAAKRGAHALPAR
jgi:hypothetical protein